VTELSRDSSREQRPADLGYARVDVDVDRVARTGDPEVVYGVGKSPDQVVGILGTLHERHPQRAVLATRLCAETMDVVRTELPGAAIREVARATTLGPLHRLLETRDRFAAADCLVVVAGMEGALPSVVGGRSGVPLVVMPTRVGYGACVFAARVARREEEAHGG